MNNETLFYAGIGIMVFSMVSAMMDFCILRMKKVRLDIRLDAEYGQKG